MFAALNIDRNNITNAVSDNMLDDLGITQADYVGFTLNNISSILTDSFHLEHRSNYFSSRVPRC